MPPNTVYVGRNSKWANPVKVCRLLSAKSATDIYTLLLDPSPEAEAILGNRARFYLSIARAKWKPITREEIVSELRGKDLACWCPLVDEDGNPAYCHRNILLEIANG